MGRLVYKDANFYFTDEGKGRAIIFLHGHLENRFMWRELCAYLPASYRKICLDLPGHGESDNLGYVHTMEDMAGLLKALVDHLKLKKFLLCGHSMGGYVALSFADKYPDYIKGLILQNSSAKADTPEKVASRKKAIEVAKRDYKSFIRLTIPMLFRSKHRRILAEEVNKVKKQALGTSKRGVIASIEGMMRRPDLEILLHFAPYNILFIAGETDPVLPYELLESQIRAPRVTALVVPNGHMSHIEDRDLLFPAIKKFAREQF